MMKFNTKETYEGLGFVEALIAIMLVGVTAVVLMQIAVDTMENMVQNETLDNMTQLAVEGAEVAQDIAGRDNTTEENIFPDKIDIELGGNCFILEKNGNTNLFDIKKNEVGFVKYTYNEEPYSYREEASLGEDSNYFRLLCLDYKESDPSPAYVLGRIIVGTVNSDGKFTRGSTVKDYTYYTVIKL